MINLLKNEATKNGANAIIIIRYFLVQKIKIKEESERLFISNKDERKNNSGYGFVHEFVACFSNQFSKYKLNLPAKQVENPQGFS